MSNDDEWELVGGVYRKKQKQANYDWVWGLVLVFVAVAALGQCSGG